jgi:D-glycero-alpha-D-manno-heptose-7-phosphate kinase
MIVTRAPLRISFIGGGTDYPEHFLQNGGAVLGTSIDKYVYVTLLELSKYAPENLRFTYRETQSVFEFGDIKHPVVREVLREFKKVPRLNIGTASDLPGNSGLGSSSSFTVAFLLALKIHGGDSNFDPEWLAKEATRIEREVLSEKGGWQDQYHAAFGGFRLYEFSRDGVSVSPRLLNNSDQIELSKYFRLVKCGDSRISSFGAMATSEALSRKGAKSESDDQARLARELYMNLKGKTVLEMSQLLFKAIESSFAYKTNFGETVIPCEVVTLGNRGKDLGATCFKLLGAGGSGFVLFGINPEESLYFDREFEKEIMPFEFSNEQASSILF